MFFMDLQPSQVQLESWKSVHFAQYSFGFQWYKFSIQLLFFSLVEMWSNGFLCQLNNS